MRNLSSVLVGVLAMAMAMGCSVSGTGDDGVDDPTPGADAGNDPVPTSCALESAYPDLGASMGGAALVETQDDMPANSLLTIQGQLNQDLTPDFMRIQLWEGYGAFTGGFAPGSISLTGDESSAISCGACVLLFGDVNTQTGAALTVLVANGGTMNITAVDKTPVTGRVTGTLSNVTLREVELQDGVEVDVAGGCTSSIAGLAFDLPVMAPQPAP